MAIIPSGVIPGRPAWAGPEPMNTDLEVESTTVAELSKSRVHGFRARSSAAPRNDPQRFLPELCSLRREDGPNDRRSAP